MRVVKDSSNDSQSVSSTLRLPVLNSDGVAPTKGSMAYDTVYDAIVYGNGDYWSKTGSSAGNVIILPAVDVPNFEPVPGGVYLFQNTNGATPTLLTLTNATMDTYDLSVGEQISWFMKGNLLSPGSCGQVVAGNAGQPLVAARYNNGIVPHAPTADGAFFTVICTAPNTYTLFIV